MTLTRKTKLWIFILVTICFIGGGVWYALRPRGLGDGFVSGNGRIEATEIDIASKTAGRIDKLLVDEGDFVKKDQFVGQLELTSLNAQRQQVSAQLAEARSDVVTQETTVTGREAETRAADALVTQREAELTVSIKHAKRTAILSKEGAAAIQDHDDDVARVESARASVASAQAQLASARAAVTTARTQVIGAHSRVDAAKATLARIESDINDASLRAPLFGRVQYRIMQPGEVVAAGGKVVNMIDLEDVYMTFFVPETAAGRITMGAEARIVLDALPDYVIPATVSYVSDVAQFTPKTVETQTERQKLMFRVKARIDPTLLREHVRQVKTGLPGVTYIKFANDKSWPDWLAVGPHHKP
ncbi:MAG: HlyD family efflux transporter periplasmic adaptor subunit [Acetobacter sp.]|jgi:HlyD family secretion protein|nr:HlyD family efflux transporter periplasmic adaptor subunit [Acetobacter sp.]MCH4060121.1 HlyD family efflux transporter periplasmic adaptor subunit [Acetobacter sp.]MCH4087061.1 HlyD family efflux transporter periplasmic adaptor subunit [Acetobacter sp.]MCI1292881.1 HlyD family efflux transporter periplasmic adaptor subunit [Acetobacter sp.]MCI1319467.1 HlyD family efflux transporter periplasmic adaptor subunit [Acetobacter sp.]